MKKILLPIIATIIYTTSIPLFSADMAAMQETTPPAANGPLEPSSITVPSEAIPKPTAQPIKTPTTQTNTPNGAQPAMPSAGNQPAMPSATPAKTPSSMLPNLDTQ